MCLDCFATTDHSSAIARLKAAATAHSELAADGIASTMVTGLSCPTHDDTHGYRVCDSTRYPISGSARFVIQWPPVGVKDDDEHTNDDKAEYRMILNDDPKSIWTAEEDLRLLDAIKTHGLGNWIDIADAISGNGSNGKTPKRCMERYFDSFLGRYGHILPEFTIVEENPNDDEAIASSSIPEANDGDANGDANDDDEDSLPSNNKRRQPSRPPSNVSIASGGGRARKRYKVVPTESLPGYKEWWPEPYLPPVEGAEMGQEVARDLSRKNELEFVKLTSAAASKEEVDAIRKEWEEKCLQQKIGAPTVLPPRPEDSDTLPGSELMGFMPRRGDFDIEHENEAEVAIAEMEFLEADTEQEKELKMKVLQIYYEKQNEREKRKQFILSRKLYDYRQYVKDEQELPRDERDLRHRMRLFERFHTPEEHKQFIDDIIKAKRLRKEIAKLQMYRRMGIRSLTEAEKYELDKSRRQCHKVAQMQKEAEAKQAVAFGASAGSASASAVTPTVSIPTMPGTSGSDGTDSLWKNYRTSERKGRRSINRTSSGLSSNISTDTRDATSATTSKEDAPTPKAEKAPDETGDVMDVARRLVPDEGLRERLDGEWQVAHRRVEARGRHGIRGAVAAVEVSRDVERRDGNVHQFGDVHVGHVTCGGLWRNDAALSRRREWRRHRRQGERRLSKRSLQAPCRHLCSQLSPCFARSLGGHGSAGGDMRQARRIESTPASSNTVLAARRAPNSSFSHSVPSAAANSTEVSRSAATVATGACVMAHSAIA